MAESPVDSYINTAPPEQADTLRELRTMIQSALPQARETMSASGFPVYTDGRGKWLAGFATRRKCPMLYIMAEGILDRYDDRLGTLRSGRSCVDWRASQSLTLDELHGLANVMLREIRAD